MYRAKAETNNNIILFKKRTQETVDDAPPLYIQRESKTPSRYYDQASRIDRFINMYSQVMYYIALSIVIVALSFLIFQHIIISLR